MTGLWQKKKIKNKKTPQLPGTWSFLSRLQAGERKQEYERVFILASENLKILLLF